LEQPEIKIVAVSGAFGGTFLQIAKRLGADATLKKPVSSSDLTATVRAVLLTPPVAAE
jgi:CheY-like chemotaxis protein